MAGTLGDIIGRNYLTGRAIGNDFASSRFAKRAQALKDEYEEKAAAEGKNIEDYLPEMEQRLEALAQDVGATRRNVTGAGGKALDREFAGTLYEGATRGSDRRAGAQALAGDQAGARTTRAATQYAIGDFDAGQQQQIAGDTIRATSGAIRKDGTYDMAGGAQALARTSAQYGDAGAANQQQANAESFRLRAATAAADSLARILQNVDKFSDDQVRGAWEGVKQHVPEFSRFDIQKGDANQIILYTDGKATGTLEPEEAMTMLSQFTRAPGETVNGWMQARLKSIEEEKSAKKEFGGKIDDAMINVIKEAKAYGIPDSLATKLTNAGTGSNDSKGWQLQELGDEPGTYMMQKGGNVYRVRTNVQADPAKGIAGGAIVVEDVNGKPVDGSVLNEADRQGFEYNVSLVKDLTNYGNQQAVTWMKAQLGALNALRDDRLGTAGKPPGSIVSGPATMEASYQPGGGNGTFSVDPIMEQQDPKAAAEIRRRETAAGNREVPFQQGGAGGAGSMPASAPQARGALSRPDAGSAATPAAPRAAAVPGSDYFRQAGTEIRDLRSQYDEAKAALENFDRQFKPQLEDETTNYMKGRFGIPSRMVGTNLDEDQQAVRDELVARVQEIEQKIFPRAREIQGEAAGRLQYDRRSKIRAEASNPLFNASRNASNSRDR